MQKLTPFKLLFTLAILIVGIVYSVLPHFIRYDTLKEEGLRYIPVTLEAEFDYVNHYGSRYRDLVDGIVIPGEIDTYEHKDGPAFFPPLEAALLTPFFLPFQSIFPGIIITDVIFPILLFAALFVLFKSFTQHSMFSLFSAFVLMLFPQLPTLIPPSSLTELKLLFFQFIPFSDAPASELSFLSRGSFIPGGPFFVVMFYGMYKALTDTRRGKLYIAVGGISYGLLFYLYFHFWVFATIFLGLLFLILLIEKNHTAARTVFFIGFVGVIISIPFWINQYTLAQLPSYDDIVVRMGIEEGHGIRLFLWKTYLLFFAMTGLSLWLGRKFSKKTLGYFLAALSLAGIIAYNVNIVTGFTILSDHWGNKVFLLTNGIIWPPLLYFLWRFAAERKLFLQKVQALFPALAVIIIVLLAAHVVESSIKENTVYAAHYTVSPAIMDAYEWLTKNTPKDSVIATPSIETNIELTAYTHNRILQARSQNNLLSKDEVLDRLYLTQKLFGVSQGRFFEMIQSRLGVFNFFTEEYNSRALDSHLRQERYPVYQLPPDVLQSLLNTYIHYELPEELPYRLDYVFVGPREQDLNINTESLKQFEVLYENNDIVIYKYE